MTLQVDVDRQEDEAIKAFERWQAWAYEHALREIEEKLRGEAESELGMRSWLPLTAFLLLVGLALSGVFWLWR